MKEEEAFGLLTRTLLVSCQFICEVTDDSTVILQYLLNLLVHQWLEKEEKRMRRREGGGGRGGEKKEEEEEEEEEQERRRRRRTSGENYNTHTHTRTTPTKKEEAVCRLTIA